MKNSLTIIPAVLAILIFCVLASCSDNRTHGEMSFLANILEINGGTVTVRPIDGEDILRSSDRIAFSNANLDDIKATVGDTVSVLYTGEIMESYPAQVNAVSWSIHAKAAANEPEAPETGHKELGKPSLEGVSLKTELEVYALDTIRIHAYWINNSDESLMFGESWHLEKNNDNVWEPVAANSEMVFNSIGYSLRPGETMIHLYWFNHFYNTLDEGRYRIATTYFNDKDIPIDSDDLYALYAEFTVSNDSSLVQGSEFDYGALENSRDLTPRDIQQISSLRVYKDKKTFDTAVVINGEEFEIAPGSGRWGVIQVAWYEADNREYLIYAYSRDSEDNDENVSRLGVFDVTERKVVFTSKDFYGIELCVGPTPLTGTEFEVLRAAHFEDEFGGYAGEIFEVIAKLAYENGGFVLREIENPLDSTAPADIHDLKYSDLAGMSFYFSSGVGAWSTEVKIMPDGTFEGKHWDTDAGDTGQGYPNGTRYFCSFRGKFSPLERTGEHEYLMKCESLTQEGTPGEEKIGNEEGVRYITSTPYGFDDADVFFLYMPGNKTDGLPEDFLGWVNAMDLDTLDFYGLYNVGGKQGFKH